MSISTGPNPATSAGSTEPHELGPLDIVALEAFLDPFCPVAANGGEYRPGLCLPWCTLCRDLLFQQEGTA